MGVSISKAASLLFATSAAASYLVIRNWSINAFISTDRSLVLPNSSSFRLRSSGVSTMPCLHMFKPIPFLFPAPTCFLVVSGSCVRGLSLANAEPNAQPPNRVLDCGIITPPNVDNYASVVQAPARRADRRGPSRSDLDAPLVGSNWVRLAKNGAFVLLMSYP